MITFFKKIRKKLIEKKEISRYFSYAFGEVFLVMIGILLAFYVSNWNSTKNNTIKEHWYLNNIIEDITYQSDGFKELIEFYSNSIKVGKSILIDYSKKNSFKNIDSLNTKLNELMYTETYPNINNTYVELTSSGQFSLIKNKELSTTIIDYYLYNADNKIIVKNNINLVYYTHIFPVLYALTEVNLKYMELSKDESILETNHQNLLKHIEHKLEDTNTQLQLINAIKLKISINDYHLSIVKDMLELGESLIKKIDKELVK